VPSLDLSAGIFLEPGSYLPIHVWLNGTRIGSGLKGGPVGWPAECRGGAEWDPERLQQLSLSGLDRPVIDTIQSSTVPFSSLAFARCPLNSPANPPRMQRSQLPNAARESVGGCNIPSLPRQSRLLTACPSLPACHAASPVRFWRAGISRRSSQPAVKLVRYVSRVGKGR
jgi:hypothetical protein